MPQTTSTQNRPQPNNTKQSGYNSKTTLDKLARLEYVFGLKGSLASYVREAWQVFEVNTPLVWNWHHDAICDHLQALYKGDIKRLLVALPPRHTKSSIISVAFPTWVWIQDPSLRFLTASYAMSLSLRDAQRCRDLIDSYWYQMYFGDLYNWLPDQNQKSRYETDKHGYRISTSVEGAATGEGADIILVDDPHNIQESESDTMRTSTLSWWDRVMTSRINDQLTGRMAVIGQRVHQQDLIGHLLDTGEWEYLCLPAEFDSSRPTVTCIGWTDPRKQDGEPLWQDKFPKSVLDYLKKTLGMHYYAQYQQRPSNEEGAIIKHSNFYTYTIEDRNYVLYTPHGEERIPIAACRTVVSSDFAVSKTQAADYTVFLTWAVTPDMRFLLREIVHERLEGPEAEDLFYALASAAERLWCVIVEDVAYQKAIIQRLQKGTPLQYRQRYVDANIPVRKKLPVLSHKPVTDKISRMQSLAVYFVGACFYFNPGVDGLVEYKKEMTTFPQSPHDDYCDASTILLKLFDEYGEPRIDLLMMTAMEEAAAIEIIAQEDKELAEFLREGSEEVGLEYSNELNDVLYF